MSCAPAEQNAWAPGWPASLMGRCRIGRKEGRKEGSRVRTERADLSMHGAE